jgi:hypothetical protein
MKRFKFANLNHALLHTTFMMMLCAAVLPAFGQKVAPSDMGISNVPFTPNRGPANDGGDPVQNQNTGATFATIQDAINAATAGQVLIILDNLAEGQVMVDKNLTIQGQTGNEVVSANADTGDVGDNRGWFLVNAGVNLDVNGLIFDGNGFNIYQAFRMNGSGSFLNITIRDINYNDGFPDSLFGFGIAMAGGAVDIDTVTFEDIGKSCVFVFGTASTTIDNCTFTGQGIGSDRVNYGVEAGGGGDAVVTNSTFTNFMASDNDPPSTNSAGALATTFFGAGTSLDMISNTITMNAYGILGGLTGVADSSSIDAHFNRIVDNNNGGVEADSSSVDLENNWWGCNDGPGASGCDNAVGGDFDPWLVLTCEMIPNTPNPYGPDVILVGQTGTAYAQLIYNSDNMNTSGLGSVPPTPVMVSVNFGSINPTFGDTVNGIFTATYTPTNVAHPNLTCTIDNQMITDRFIVHPVIPTLGEWGLIAFVTLLVGAAVFMMRKQRLAGA